MADRFKDRFKAIANILNPIKNAYGLSEMADEYFNFIYVSWLSQDPRPFAF